MTQRLKPVRLSVGFNHTLSNTYTMRHLMYITLCLLGLSANAQSTILINNVVIFNGKDEKTITGNVLVVNNLIQKISTSPIPTNKSGKTVIIDGKG
ncbi:MAG TPA: hypothetical protein PLR30_10410, partial [Saprospiraceae bacterium]|nr:hypothetical protein [Saprospiraceae bacterium]